jgi:hypothetical protein
VHSIQFSPSISMIPIIAIALQSINSPVGCGV